MRNPVLPPLMLLVLAAALYMLPDGSFYSWQLALRGAYARLFRPPDPRPDIEPGRFDDRRDLLDLLAQKNSEIADLHRRIRELGVTREEVGDIGIIPARIVRLGPDNTLDTFTIDAGSGDGVRPGDPLVVGQALVGIVVRSDEHASLALSLSSTGCYISARLGEPESSVERPRQLAAVRGAGDGEVRAIVFSSATAAKTGWAVTTSGLEAAVPEGLLIGAIAGPFGEGLESGTTEAELRPATDLSSLDFVAVVARR